MEKDLRQNLLRRQILTLLTQKPGMNRNQISRTLKVSQNAANFQVGRLEEAGLIETHPRGPGAEMLCFTKDKAHLWDDESTRILYGRGPALQVALYISENEGASTKQISEALALSIDTVRSHLRMLEEHDLIQRIRIEQQVRYHPVLKLEAWSKEVAGECTRKWRAEGG